MEFYSQNINWILLFALLNKIEVEYKLILTILFLATVFGWIIFTILFDKKRRKKSAQIKNETLQTEDNSRNNQPEFLSESEFRSEVLLQLQKMATSQEKTQSNVSLITNILVITFVCSIIAAIITIVYLS